jgi:pimeloyl-ACP methyl ester carboxylesterase
VAALWQHGGVSSSAIVAHDYGVSVAQELLARGATLSAAITEELFVAGLRPTFVDSYDADADSHEMWRGMSRANGHHGSHRLIQYISDRERHSQRWVLALEQTTVPVSFVWGMLDPVSGAHMAQRIRERLPAAPFQELADVAHWPPLEAPDRVAAALLSY